MENLDYIKINNFFSSKDLKNMKIGEDACKAYN